MRQFSVGRPVAVLLLVTLLAAGCTKQAADAGVASAAGANGGNAGGGGGATGSPLPSGAVYDPVKWAQCLRQHGLQVDDPDPDPAAGRTKPDIHTDGVPQSRIDAATAACRRYNPRFGQPAAVDPAEEQRMYEFGKCMREHGIELETGPSSQAVPGAPPQAPPADTPTVSGEQFEKAVRECNQRVPGVASTNFPDTKN